MIKILLLVLFLAELGMDVHPLDYLATINKRATCQRVMKRLVKCSGPKTTKMFTPQLQRRLVKECAKQRNRKDFHKAVRCLREKSCRKFESCLVR